MIAYERYVRASKIKGKGRREGVAEARAEDSGEVEKASVQGAGEGTQDSQKIRAGNNTLLEVAYSLKSSRLIGSLTGILRAGVGFAGPSELRMGDALSTPVLREQKPRGSRCCFMCTVTEMPV